LEETSKEFSVLKDRVLVPEPLYKEFESEAKKSIKMVTYHLKFSKGS
jgi:hypothetical protein